MKRANRLLRYIVTHDEYDAMMNLWKQHLQWMHLNIAYFKPWPSVIPGKRIRQQRDLDHLVEMATEGIRNEGLQPPNETEMRRLMRLYARSARRGREGKWGVPFILANRNDFTRKWVLARFVIRRSQLARLP